MVSDTDGDYDVAGFDAGSGVDLDVENQPGDPEPGESHRHIVMSDGNEICPAAVMGALGDVLHATAGVDAIKWDVVELCKPDIIPPSVYAMYECVTEAVRLCNTQIAYALRSIAVASGDVKTTALLDGLPDRLSRIEAEEVEESFDHSEAGPFSGRPWPTPPPGALRRIPLEALLPMHPSHGLRDESVSALKRGAAVFEAVLSGKRPAERLFKDDEMMTLAFSWHRHSVAQGALHALEEERKALGEKWNLDGLRAREVPYLLTSEVAGLMSAWSSEGHVSDAAAAISTSIRSAYWLWLENDDRAMGILRTTLEQAARLRAWRRRPDKVRGLRHPSARHLATGWRQPDSVGLKPLTGLSGKWRMHEPASGGTELVSYSHNCNRRSRRKRRYIQPAASA